MASALAGLGSNLDINTLVTNLMNVEKVPLKALTDKNTKYQATLSAFGTTKGALSSVQAAAQALKDAMASIPATATVSAPTVVSATAAGGATPTNIGLTVQSLAQAQRLYSGAFASVDTVVGGGTLTIDRGSFTNSTFIVNTNIPAATITIPANATLTDILDAINNAQAGVTASIVNDGSGFRLVLGANDTGAAQGMRINVADDDGNPTDPVGLSKLAYDPAAAVNNGRNLTQARAAADAVFSIDGLPMSRPTNSVADAVASVTLTLTATGDTNVSITRDLTKMRSALDDLVKAYNSASGTMKSQTSYDPATRTGGPLNGESSVRGILSQLRRTVTSSYGVDGDAYRTLSSLGVSFKSDGTLSVESTKYNAAMSANAVAASKMIGAFASTLNDSLTTTLGGDGPLASRTNGLQTAMKRVTDDQTRMQARLDAIEARYRTQFSALDSMLSSMNSTTSFLKQQFNNSQN
jgi:flagellar hook-associated protein 2